MTWFFKMIGDAGLVEQQKPEFTAFLKSLTFTAAAQRRPCHPDTQPLAVRTRPRP